MSWEENVRRVVPYVAGEQPTQKNIIKLNTNESPYPPAPGVQEQAEHFLSENLKLYPDMDATELVNSLAEYYQVEPDQIFVGVGSDDVLALAFLTFFNSDQPILFPNLTYSFYDVWADLYRIPYKTCELDADFHIRKEDYMQKNGGIIFPNPNAPTGVLESVSMIEDMIKANPGVVVIIDEAYIDFGGESCLPLLDQYDNLLVVQTFSKSRAMAGLRIGFAIGNPKMIQYLKDAKFSTNSYTMNLPALKLGVEAVKDEKYFHEMVHKIIDTRERAKAEMAKLGFSFTDSQSNFLFVTHKTKSAKEIYEGLKERNIYVRYWDKPILNNRLRITIGTDAQMDVVFAALKEIL